MPKLQTYRKWPYSGNLYNYNTTSDPEGEPIYTYYFHKAVKLDVAQGLFGRINVFFPNEYDDIMLKAQIQQLTDVNGNEIYPSGLWTLTSFMPIVNLFGQREGFRGEARLTVP